MKNRLSGFTPARVMSLLRLIIAVVLAMCLTTPANAVESSTPKPHATDVAAGLTSLDRIDVDVTSTHIGSIKDLNDYLQSDALKDVTVDPESGNIVAVSDLREAPIPRYIR